MNFKAKLINIVYEMSTILSFAFSLDFIILYRDISMISQIMLVLWLAVTAVGVLKIVFNRIFLNRTREVLFAEALAEIKEDFSDNEYASSIYILMGMLMLSIKVSIPFFIAL
ncbi:hypothetical protein [uncultured Clostridium sp.]|uniref:hypothetical protein n=1 Tax=uncultured Clostridium sp. TaxID=59620 RepID=UPI0025CDBC3A|nr:hypothetical protein [uncultured Clostridium sp.]